MTKVVGCMANRQIARDLRVSPPTIDRRVERLGRHCLLFHLQAVRDLAPRKEVAVDGFESFEFSQYHRSITTWLSTPRPASSCRSPTARCGARAG
ncbi:MAG: hypothetical protein R3D98_11800 [Candidatus Krumholzibacteriia bacterium]